MAYELREGQGSLFKNNNRSSEKAPSMTGKLLLGGRMYRVVGWTKGPDKNGDKWLELKAEPQDGTQRDTRPMQDQLDDQIPF